MAERKPYNAGDEVAVAEARKREKKKDTIEEGDLRLVLSTVEGRRFLLKLIADCGLLRTSFTGNANTYFNEGRRDVALQLLAAITSLCPEQYLLAQQEHYQRENDND